MRLVSFSVENYRSITKARKVPLEDYTVLIGANNEGKSNILNALSLGMRAFTNYRDGGPLRSNIAMPSRMIEYDWESDFPLSKQGGKGPKETKVTLEFDLSENERIEFKEATGSSNNGSLSIELSIGDREYHLSVMKPGKGHATVNRNKYKIARFIASRVKFEYIPAIRTASAAQRVIADLVERELAKLDTNPAYVEALASIEQLQTPILESIALSVGNSTRMFLPQIKGVELKPEKDRYRALRRNVDIFVNDGERTHLRRKGDGVQSLVALGVMRYAANVDRSFTNSIFAIEEPEAHLHPDAVHALRTVLATLAAGNQMVVSSHSPLFVNRSNLKSNVIVQRSEARPARNIAELRAVLGVRLSDNLQNASTVLLVEGPDDVLALRAILVTRSECIRDALTAGRLVIDPILGASGLSQKSSFYSSGACGVHAYLDCDSAGKEGARKAIEAKVIDQGCINFSSVPGMIESELEDLYDKEVYADGFREKFGVDVKIKIPGKVGKFSVNMERLFSFSGKLWNDATKASVKNWLASFAADHADRIVSKHKSGSVDALISSLEAKLSSGG